MRDRRNHFKGLRAALQVARGNRQTVVAAAVIGLTPGCGAEGPVDTADQDASSLDASRSQDGTVDPVDALIADVEADVTQSSDDVPTASDAGQASDAAGPTDDAELFDVAEDTASSDGASEDTASSDDATEDITAIADTTSGSDADEPFDVEPSQDMSGPSEDASESDTTEECIAYCWQPIEQACEAPEDCDREATEGTCSDSGDACIYDFECGQDATCEGAIQAASAYVDDDGKVSPSSQLNCIDGFCHEGDMINDDAMACCSGQMGQATPDFCPESDEWMWTGGCTPWGPPAPPEFDGESLAERAERLFA